MRTGKKIKDPGRIDEREECWTLMANKKERKRAKKEAVAQETLEDSWDEESGGEDFEDNLTFHEDTLSVMKGVVSTPLGNDTPIWVTTDSGSMTQLIQADYAKALKLPMKEMGAKSCFNIASPGGGGEFIHNYVVLMLRFRAKKEGSEGQAYEDNQAPEEEVTIRMKFGVCESLPVPILWGGKEMRGYDLLDYHRNKVLSLKIENRRVVTVSSSWLVASTQMALINEPRLKKAYKPFCPSKERLANMIRGERRTTNMGAVLYPGRDSVVRVGRHNARVDEGYNEVVAINAQEVMDQFKGWVITIDSVVNGEAFIIVRNNSEHAISLPAGTLVISIRPALCLPRILTKTDVQKMKDAESELPAIKEDSPAVTMATLSEFTDLDETLSNAQDPLTFFSWNCNGLSGRVKKKQLNDKFYPRVKIHLPDIVSIQEVRLQCGEGTPDTVLEGSADAAIWDEFMAPLRGTYDAYLSLSTLKYGGQAVLVKKCLTTPRVTYNMNGKGGHYGSGRFIKLDFNNLVVTSVYAPFNGVGKDHQLQRRRLWDKDLTDEVTGHSEDKGRVLLGDFNAVHRDSDMSPHYSFWKQQGLQEVEEGDRGFGGTTENERARFKTLLKLGHLSDSFTAPSGIKLEAKWTFRGEGKFYGKGLKLDYIFTDDPIMLSGGVKSSRILCNGIDRDGFMGSDHAPIWCTLHPRWRKKRDNLLLQYGKRTTGEEKQSPNYQLVNNVGTGHPATGKKGPLGISTAKRPDEFPRHLWKYVDPEEKPKIDRRFKGFKSKAYLEDCINQVEEKLDIQGREECYSPEWKPEDDNEPWAERDVLLAQAIANLDIYFFPDPDKVAMAKDVVAEVETMDDKPFKCRTRKLSVVQQAFLQAKTNIMLRMKQLEEAKSDWCHGLVLVAYEDRINRFMEKHGEEAMEKMFHEEHEVEVATFFRLCIDLRMLNAKTIPDRFPLPRIDDLLESIPRGCGRFSISDIADAFFKCELRAEHRHKTAFKTHNRHLQFSVLPQGFINSPSVFCRLIARTFEGMDRSKFSAYIDDVLNHTEEFGSHLATQQDMYNRLRQSQLTLKLSKTHLNYREVKFLGHILTKEGRLPDPKAVEAILEWKDPTTTKEVRSFLGATLYYREYIYEYSDMAMPLYDLIKKGVVVEKAWDPEIHGKAIKRIKDALTSKPVLMQVDNTKKFRLKVDACRVGRGIGGILEQQNDEGRWQPVSYYSSSLSKEERNYSATELECKALHDCILHYSVYLKYIPHFEVFSDHNALRYMVNSENATTNGRLMRYLLDLQGYNFAIYYRKGTENCDADAVSRLKRTSDEPVYLTEEELNQENGVVSRQLLQRARSLDARNKKTEKEARRLLNKIAKQDLNEMSILNDHILSEGVENLESESGRNRFFENIRRKGLNCTRENLDTTLDSMTEDKGGKTGETHLAAEVWNSEEPAVVALVDVWCETGPAEAVDPTVQCMNAMIDCEKEMRRVPYYVDLEKVASEASLPGLLINMVDVVNNDLENQGRQAERREDLMFDDLLKKRVTTNERIVQLGISQMTLMGRATRSGAYLLEEQEKRVEKKDTEEPDVVVQEEYGDYPRSESVSREGREDGKDSRSNHYQLRRVRPVDYYSEAKTPPSWIRATQADKTLLLERDPINEKLETIRRPGYGAVEVRPSLIPGDSGLGLYAKKKLKEGKMFCTYGGVEVSEDTLRQGYGSRDYVASAVKDHRTMEMVYIDGEDALCGYGRFIQDPIDEHLVNAKILWRDGKMVVIAMCIIEPGEEIYAEYGLDYWRDRMHILHPDLRQRIAGKFKGPTVRFEQECTRSDFVVGSQPSSRDGLRVQAEGVPLQRAPDNLLTRAAQFMPETEEEEASNSDEVAIAKIQEETSFENVNECPELAEELQFLNGRKFRDEGRLYEIWQLRYDEDSGRIIAFRRPLSGRTDREDGCPFLVYGLEGLYELSERYLLTHPEDRETAKWPKTNSEWAERQIQDPDLMTIVDAIEASGGMSAKIGRDKYSLMPTDDAKVKLLVRIVVDTRKGVLEQTVVPRSLMKSTLRVHHEGFGHMGANRMLETIRLRYFWSKMDQDIIKHTNKCINCKLRKTYQRRPVVPIMKYNDTARPLDRVHVDLTGPLPTTKGGHKYIMVLKDYLTKYVWLIPLKTKGSVEVAEAFVGEFVCQAGVPGRVVSDKGNEFVNQLLMNISRILGINRVSTTPYNPRSDGFVENHNKTLKDQLFHYVDNLKQDDWDVFLPTVQLMYNTTVSLATGYTPMLLMTGREARMPSFSHMASVAERAIMKDPLNNEMVLKMVETMRGYHDYALKQTAKNKGRFNERVRKPLEFVEYKPGQEFLKVRRPISAFQSADEKEKWKISMKLMERYEGPYKVIRRINPVLYDAEVNGKEVRVHASNMKPF